jgi:hypothetical protein
MGQQAFEAYAEHMQHTTQDGQVIPPWTGLAPETQEAWCVAGRAVLQVLGVNVPTDRVSRETSTEEVPDGA